MHFRLLPGFFKDENVEYSTIQSGPFPSRYLIPIILFRPDDYMHRLLLKRWDLVNFITVRRMAWSSRDWHGFQSAPGALVISQHYGNGSCISFPMITDPHALVLLRFLILLVFSVVLHFTLLKGRRRSSQLPLLHTTKANFEDAEDATQQQQQLLPLPGNAQSRLAPILLNRKGLSWPSGSPHRSIAKRSSRKGASVMRALTMRVRRSL